MDRAVPACRCSAGAIRSKRKPCGRASSGRRACTSHLLTAFKPQFLESANHYADLGEHRQQFAAFLTYAALGPTEGYTVEEFRSAIGALPQEGLEESAQALSQALEGAADQREDYWKNRVQPFWQQVWPKSRDLATRRIAESLTRLVIAARGEFPAALAAVQDWLQPIEHPHYVVHLLHESGLCSRYPDGCIAPAECRDCRPTVGTPGVGAMLGRDRAGRATACARCPIPAATRIFPEARM